MATKKKLSPTQMKTIKAARSITLTGKNHAAPKGITINSQPKGA